MRTVRSGSPAEYNVAHVKERQVGESISGFHTLKAAEPAFLQSQRRSL